MNRKENFKNRLLSCSSKEEISVFLGWRLGDEAIQDAPIKNKALKHLADMD
jgi:hypothetical protein